MRFKLSVLAVSLLCLLAVPAFSADVTGTWLTEVAAPKGGQGGGGFGGRGGFGGGGGLGVGQSAPRKMIFKFKVKGDKLKGKFTGFAGNTNKIVDGKIDGDKLTFAVKTTARNMSITLEFEGTVSGDEFKYTYKMKMDGGFGGGRGGGGFGGGGQGGGNMPPQEYVAIRQK